MANQINCSSAFKRFANASQADVAKIHEDTHEKATKDSTCWAVNVFEGKADLRCVIDTTAARRFCVHCCTTTVYYIRILSKLHYQNSKLQGRVGQNGRGSYVRKAPICWTCGIIIWIRCKCWWCSAARCTERCSAAYATVRDIAAAAAAAGKQQCRHKLLLLIHL